MSDTRAGIFSPIREMRLVAKDATPVLVIDLSSLVHPLYHMSGNEPDPNWTTTQAVAKVRELASNRPLVAICTDSGRSFRKDIDPTYKANRPEKQEPLMHQLRLTEEKLAADGLPVLKANGYEADDLIAAVVNDAVGQGRPVLVASSDKDLLQLVDDAAKVEVMSLRDGTVYDEEGVYQKFKVKPTQMRDYLALVGDSSDNVKGAPGIGPVKAADLLATFGTLDDIALEAAKPNGNLLPATKKSIVEHGLAIERAKLLVTLRADAPIDLAALYRDREAPMHEPVTDDEQPDQPNGQPIPAMTPAAPQTALAPLQAPIAPVGEWDRQLEPRSVEEARTTAKWLHDSRLFSQYGSPQAVFAVVLAGRELGLGTMASLRAFHIVQGRPTMSADLIRALVMSSGKAEYLMCKERTATSATWVTKRKGDPEPITLTFTMEEAKTAKLVTGGSGWEKHPADMVTKTAAAKLCRLVYPDVTFGLYTPEEMGGDSV